MELETILDTNNMLLLFNSGYSLVVKVRFVFRKSQGIIKSFTFFLNLISKRDSISPIIAIVENTYSFKNFSSILEEANILNKKIYGEKFQNKNFIGTKSPIMEKSGAMLYIVINQISLIC